jgi:hypothetical protein
MPKSRITIHTEHLIELKRFIQLRYGKTVDSLLDCERLAEIIYQVTRKTLSKDTLRRVFQLISTVSKPSIFTLDTLSQYAGFSNYSSFCKAYQNSQKQFLSYQIVLANSQQFGSSAMLPFISRLPEDSDTYNSIQQLMLTAFHQQDEKFFEQLFTLSNLFKWKDENKYGIYHTVKLLGILCKSETWLQKIAISNYSGLPYEVDYFVEWAVNYDDAYYDQLLDKYAQQHTLNEEKTLFYHSLKTLISFKKKDIKSFEFHYVNLPKFPDKNVVNNIVWSRIIGSHYLYFFKNQMHNEWNEFHKIVLSWNWKKYFDDPGDRLTSLLFVCEYLYLLRDFSSVIELTTLHMPGLEPDFSIWTNQNFSKLNLYIASSFLELSDLNSARKAFSNINQVFFSLENEGQTSKIFESVKKLVFI